MILQSLQAKKEIRQAREALAYRNGQLYRFEYYSEKGRIKELLDVDESFEKSLNLLGLSAERWKKIQGQLPSAVPPATTKTIKVI